MKKPIFITVILAYLGLFLAGIWLLFSELTFPERCLIAGGAGVAYLWWIVWHMSGRIKRRELVNG